MNRLANLSTDLERKVWSIVFWEVVEQLNTVSVSYSIMYSDDTLVLYPTRVCWCNGKDRGWGVLYPIGTDKNWWKKFH